ncbi:hypothetical protein ACPC54_32600 [Kitasatospora sp. NPDC094028]
MSGPAAAGSGHRRRARRTGRTVHALTGVAVLLSAAVGAEATADTTRPPSTAEQEKGMRAGLPFDDPATVDATAADGESVTVTLGAARSRLDVSGRAVYGASYTGSFVAPHHPGRPGVDRHRPPRQRAPSLPSWANLPDNRCCLTHARTSDTLN